MSWILYVILIIIFLILMSRININEEDIDNFYFTQLRYLVENPRPKFGKPKRLADKATTESLKKYQLESIDMMQEIFKSVKSNGMIPEKYRVTFIVHDFHFNFRYQILSYVKSYFNNDKNYRKAEKIIDKIDDEAFLLAEKVIGIGDIKE